MWCGMAARDSSELLCPAFKKCKQIKPTSVYRDVARNPPDIKGSGFLCLLNRTHDIQIKTKARNMYNKHRRY